MTNQKWTSYAKFIVAAVIAAVYALQAALSDDVVTGGEWGGIIAAALSSIVVYLTPNKPYVQTDDTSVTGL